MADAHGDPARTTGPSESVHEAHRPEFIEMCKQLRDTIQGMSEDIQGISEDIRGMGKDIRGVSEDLRGMRKDVWAIDDGFRHVRKDMEHYHTSIMTQLHTALETVERNNECKRKARTVSDLDKWTGEGFGVYCNTVREAAEGIGGCSNNKASGVASDFDKGVPEAAERISNVSNEKRKAETVNDLDKWVGDDFELYRTAIRDATERISKGTDKKRKLSFAALLREASRIDGCAFDSKQEAWVDSDLDKWSSDAFEQYRAAVLEATKKISNDNNKGRKLSFVELVREISRDDE